MSAAEQRKYWVGFDLGGTKMMTVVFDDKFKPLGRKKKKTKGYMGVEAGLQRMADAIRDACKEADIKPDEIAGIGVGCPGPLDLDRGIMFLAPNLGWENAHVKDSLEEAFGCPTIIMNDVDAGTYGEYVFGAAKGAHCALGVFPGTGIGAGCIYEERVLRGKTSSCLELGHIQVVPDGPLCGCGLRGCLEAVASRLAISSAAAAAAYRGDAPHLLESAGMDLANIRSGVLADSIEAGDKAVENIVKQAAMWLGVSVAMCVHLLAPDVVVLGGGLVEALPKIFLKEVSESARKHTMEAYRDSFAVRVAELGDDAAVKGTAAWARYHVTHSKDQNE